MQVLRYLAMASLVDFHCASRVGALSSAQCESFDVNGCPTVPSVSKQTRGNSSLGTAGIMRCSRGTAQHADPRPGINRDETNNHLTQQLVCQRPPGSPASSFPRGSRLPDARRWTKEARNKFIRVQYCTGTGTCEADERRLYAFQVESMNGSEMPDLQKSSRKYSRNLSSSVPSFFVSCGFSLLSLCLLFACGVDDQ